ncbi:MAG: lipase [Aeromicrobium sp.]|nr:lipase [Aeromicrobium sp.]
MIGSVSVDISQLYHLANSLGVCSEALHLNDQRPDGGQVGNTDLHGALDHFFNNWNYKRDDLSTKLHKLSQGVVDAATKYQTLEKQLHDAISGSAGASSTGLRVTPSGPGGTLHVTPTPQGPPLHVTPSTEWQPAVGALGGIAGIVARWIKQHPLTPPVVPPTPTPQGPQKFNNASVADMAEKEIGPDLKNETYKGQGGTNQPGACMVAASRWLKAAGGSWPGGMSDPLVSYRSAGALSVDVPSARRGDLLQRSIPGDVEWTSVHTVVVLENHGDGTFKIAESNWDNLGDARIVDGWKPEPKGTATWTAWQFGQV